MSTTEVEMASARTPSTDEKGASKTVDVYEPPTGNYAGSDAGRDAGSDQAVIEVSEDDTDVATATKRGGNRGLQVYDTAGDYELPALIPEEHFGFNKDNKKVGMNEWRIGGCSPELGKKCGLCKPIIFNPLSTLIGFGVLLGFALWCITDPINSKTELGIWQKWCTKMFSWFYISSQNVWIMFLAAVYYYYGHVRLGKNTDRPEFDNATYFAMLFSAGVAVGLFVFGTAEPLYHYDYWVKHRYNGQGDETQNDKANYAMMTTLFHWGFHGWCVYTLVGLQMGIMAYRKQLPLTMRTCFYPLLGRYTWGWMGDVIDGFSIVTIVAGVCTSLGLGAIQISRGLSGMGAVDAAANPDDILLMIIWVITAIATVSVISGVHMGIKTLSQLAFSMGLFILVVVFFAGPTSFYLANMSTSIGYYFHYSFTKVGWHTDAFAQLGFGEGASPDALGASKADQAYGGAPSFMDGWTIFYWGWWIAWSPFVGMFIARISRGRTVGEVILYTLTGPLLFCFMWFGVFGGAAIQMENQAQMLWRAGAEIWNDPSYYQTGQGSNAMHSFSGPYAGVPVGAVKDGFGSGPYCWQKLNITEWDPKSFTGYCHPAGSGILNVKGCTSLGHKAQGKGSTSYLAAQGCGACFVQQAAFGDATYAINSKTGKNEQVSGQSGCQLWQKNNVDKDGKAKACPFWIKSWKANPALSPQCLFTDYDQEASWYNVVGQFYGLGPFLQGLSIVTLTFYFVTSSDSGSLVVDTISAGGRDEQNPIQRVIWALVEGLVATGLVVGGSGNEDTSAKNVLKALQAASICCGLPFTFLLCFMMPALWLGLKSEDEASKNGPAPKYFKVSVYGGIFDFFEWFFSCGQSVPLPNMHTIAQFFLGLGAAPYKMWHVLTLMEEAEIGMKMCGSTFLNKIGYCLFSTFCFISWIVMICFPADSGLWSVGFTLFAAHAALLMIIRLEVRGCLGLAGNVCEDFFASLCLYPQVLHQVEEELHAHLETPHFHHMSKSDTDAAGTVVYQAD